MFSSTALIYPVSAWLHRKALLSGAPTASLQRKTHLDDQVPLGVTGHSAEFSSQLLELRPAVCVNHPACGGRGGAGEEEEVREMNRCAGNCSNHNMVMHVCKSSYSEVEMLLTDCRIIKSCCFLNCSTTFNKFLCWFIATFFKGRLLAFYRICRFTQPHHCHPSACSHISKICIYLSVKNSEDACWSVTSVEVGRRTYSKLKLHPF